MWRITRILEDFLSYIETLPETERQIVLLSVIGCYTSNEIGKILEIGADSAKFNGTVPAGIVLVDGTGIGDVGNVVLRDRRHLSEDGIIIVVSTIDAQAYDIISGPEIVSRGFVYAKESEKLIDQIRLIARDAIYGCLNKGVSDWTQLKYKVKDDLSKFIYSQTKRKPMILPIIMDI